MAKYKRKSLRLALPKEVLEPVIPVWCLSDFGKPLTDNPALERANAQQEANFDLMFKHYGIPSNCPDKYRRLLMCVVPGLRVVSPSGRHRKGGAYRWTDIELSKLVVRVTSKINERKAAVDRNGGPVEDALRQLVKRGAFYEGENWESLRRRFYEASSAGKNSNKSLSGRRVRSKAALREVGGEPTETELEWDEWLTDLDRITAEERQLREKRERAIKERKPRQLRSANSKSTKFH
jgi:hypothetical protein